MTLFSRSVIKSSSDNSTSFSSGQTDYEWTYEWIDD